MVSAVRLAAVAYRRGFQVDDFLNEIASVLRAEGATLGGAVQQNMPGHATPCSAMVLEDLKSHNQISISQELGPQASGCRLDPCRLADVGARLDRTINDGSNELELVIVNKFGQAEAEGAGLRSVMTRAVEAGIPVLTSVRPPHTVAWSEFHAGLATKLQPEAGPVLAWCRASIQTVRTIRQAEATRLRSPSPTATQRGNTARAS